MSKELQAVLAELEAQGFAVRRTAKGHHFVTKNGQPVTTFAGTASDYRSLKNGLAAAKRAGFRWPK